MPSKKDSVGEWRGFRKLRGAQERMVPEIVQN